MTRAWCGALIIMHDARNQVGREWSNLAPYDSFAPGGASG
jgi:hypothetical protein